MLPLIICKYSDCLNSPINNVTNEMKSNSKQTSASKIVALNVSFKSCLYFEFLLSLSANAHKMLSVEKNIAIRIDKVILRLFNIPLSTQRIFKIPIENKPT